MNNTTFKKLLTWVKGVRTYVSQSSNILALNQGHKYTDTHFIM